MWNGTVDRVSVAELCRLLRVRYIRIRPPVSEHGEELLIREIVTISEYIKVYHVILRRKARNRIHEEKLWGMVRPTLMQGN